MITNMANWKHLLGRGGIWLAIILPIFALVEAAGCTSRSPAAPAAPAAPATQSAAPLVGHWAGSTHIIVNWTQARSLPVQMDIHPNGAVSGRIGDAALKDGVLGTTHFAGLVFGVPESTHGQPPASLGAGDHFQITAHLDGPLLASEQSRRDGVIIIFHLLPDQALHGSLTSTGSDFGGKDSMKLAATNMVLTQP